MSRGVLVLLLVAALTACASDGDPADTAPSTSSPSPSESSPTSDPAPGKPVRAGEAQQALKAALRKMGERKFIAFRQTTSGASVSPITTEGAFVFPGSWFATSNFIDGSNGRPDVLRTLSTNGLVWMQLDSWTGPQAGCWLTMEPGTVPLGIQAMFPGQPAYVGALRFIRALGFDSNDPSVIVGQVPLSSALSLVTGQVTATMQPLFKDGMAGVVTVTITLTKDGVTSITIPGTAILKTLKRAATKVPAEVSTYLEGDTETLEFPEADAPEAIQEPAKDLVFFADRDGCVAGSQ